MCPKEWDFRLINRNTEELTDADIDWADLVMIGGMLNQQPDFLYLIELAHLHNKPVVRRRAGRVVEPASLRGGRLPGDRRGRAHHGGLHRRVGARRAQGRVHRREIQDRHDAVAAAALRSAEARAVSLHRHPVLARLPVHLRVLRHHRAVRPRAAHQDQRPDLRRAAGALRSRLSRACRFRRRQLHRQPQERASDDAEAEGVAARSTTTRSSSRPKPRSTSPTTTTCCSR